MIDGTPHRGGPQPFLTDERLGKAGGGGGSASTRADRERQVITKKRASLLAEKGFGAHAADRSRELLPSAAIGQR